MPRLGRPEEVTSRNFPAIDILSKLPHSRNNALVGVVLMLASILSQQWIGLAVSGVLFLLFAHEAYGEQRFFSRYLQVVTKELRELDAATKEE